MEKITLEREATPAEAEAIRQAQDILDTVDLELIGTRPKDRS